MQEKEENNLFLSFPLGNVYALAHKINRFSNTIGKLNTFEHSISQPSTVIMICIIIFLTGLELIQGLVQCNGTVTKLQLCSLEADYNARSTGKNTKTNGYPLQLKTAVNVLKIAQFDESHNTITLNVLLSVIWNDTRLR